MVVYKAPIDDMRFVLHDVINVEQLTALEGYEEATADLVDAVLEEAGKVTENVLFPLNRSGDEEGCTLENGVVRTPTGFPEAYATFVEGGWASLSCDPHYGGQGLPHTVNTMVSEMICASNLSFSLYPGLSHGVYSALKLFGSDTLKEAYLPKLTDGTWAGTMCLTEPHCGTDLGLLRTKAAPQSDDSYRVSGTKIFISAGEHDLTENIIHLVLARLSDAPAGIKGISLFLVPKFLPNDDGTLGERNGVRCGSLEKKMGIKASSTCEMVLENAKGWLVGSKHKGMRAMFAMMNEARFLVGIQGLGAGVASYQGAVAYAKERLQGRSLGGTKQPDRSADPIIVHPDVRRMLLTQRAYIEGSRALGAWVAMEIDKSHKAATPEERQKADDFVQLMTPIVKSLFTDLGSEIANIGMQVLGGHGYIREHGMEQYVRDCRITQIYEGTNGVQALDLIGRKLPAYAGRYLRSFFHPVQAYIEENMDDEQLAEFVEPLAKAFVRLQQATGTLIQRGMSNQEEAASMANDYLRLFGLVAMSYMWCRMAEAAFKKMDEDAKFAQAKLDTARFFTAKLLPQTSSLFATTMAGGKTLMAMEEEAF